MPTGEPYRIDADPGDEYPLTIVRNRDSAIFEGSYIAVKFWSRFAELFNQKMVNFKKEHEP